ncbi:MAG TPA: sigma-54 dependent transcriptional regulator [Blastocatellia bacterium]|nr:sigma-54 dependent transcriptional regulator [Blastocatellia bacterium]
MTQIEPASVLVIDDDQTIRELLNESLAEDGFMVESAPSAEDALVKVRQTPYDAIVTDLNLPGLRGTEVVRQALTLFPDTVIVVMTGAGSVSAAVECMKLGAYDFLSKPFDIDVLTDLIRGAINVRAERAMRPTRVTGPLEMPAHLTGPSADDRNMIGESEAMREVFDLIEIVARSNSTVLVTGETGTGKELVARALHARSRRNKGPFVSLNCAAVPETLLEDELFGHVRGAFTGAQAARAGRFEQAQHGTLFLDEIGCINLQVQAKLLRVLQEREVERLGSSQTIKCDVRIIAATSADLEAMIEEGTFRRDLYYRLNVIPTKLPALRQRREDIPHLVRHFVAKYCEDLGFEEQQVSHLAIKRLMQYDWPGNVRELENAIERAVVLSRGRGEILHTDLPMEVSGAPLPDLLNQIHLPEGGINMEDVVASIERELLRQSLQMAGGNQSQAAELLGLKRTTFLDKLKRLRLADD